MCFRVNNNLKIWRRFDQNWVKTKRPLIWETHQKWSTLHIFWITMGHVICYFWRIVNWSSIFGWVEITLGLLNFRCWNILRLFMFVLDVFWIEDDPAHDGNSNIVFSSMQKNFYFVKIHQKSKENDRKSSTYHSSSGSCSIFPADRAPNSFMDNLYMAFDLFEFTNCFCLFLDTLFFLMLVCMQRLYIFVNKVILMEKTYSSGYNCENESALL